MRLLDDFQFFVSMKASAIRQAAVDALPMLSPQEALNRAVERGQPRAIERAIRAGADPDASFALHSCARHGYAECVKALLPHCDPTLLDSQGWSALRSAAVRSSPQHLECVKLLIPCSPMERDPVLGQTPLMSAAVGGSAEMVKLLLPLCDPLLADACGTTALMQAAKRFESEPLLALIPHSALAAADLHGNTALSIIASSRREYAQNFELLMAASDLSDPAQAEPLKKALAGRMYVERHRQLAQGEASPEAAPPESPGRPFWTAPSSPRR